MSLTMPLHDTVPTQHEPYPSELSSQTQSERFAEFASGFTLDEAPSEIVDYARLLTIDLLGCAIAARDTEEAKCTLAACLDLDWRGGSASLWGTGFSASPRSAALFNGVISHTLELDDFLGIDHTGAVVAPALFATMEDTGVFDERRFLEAMILGYEIGRRMLDTAGGYRKHNDTGWHTSGTLGAFAAAVAVSRYLGLDEKPMVSAIGLAGSFTGGTWAFNEDGAMSKRYHCGKAAETGLGCAYLARSGMTGPRFIFEADWGGYFALYATNHDCRPDTLFDALGERLRIGDTGIKPYACCRGNHSAIDAVFEIKSRCAIHADSIETIRVRCSEAQFRQLGNPDPKTVVDAQLSLPFAVANAILHEDVGYARFSEPNIADPVIRSLCRRVVFDVEDGWPVRGEPVVELHNTDGSRHCQQVPIARGDPRNPLTIDEVLGKFESLAGSALSATQMDAVTGFATGADNSLMKIRHVLATRLGPSE